MERFKGLLISLSICTILAGSIGLVWFTTYSTNNDMTIGMVTTLEDPDPAEH